MKVLFLAWEYPPYHSGGLGIACEGLANALAGSHDVTVLIPEIQGDEKSNPKILSASKFAPTKETPTDLDSIPFTQDLVTYLPPAIFKSARKEQKPRIIRDEELLDVLVDTRFTHDYAGDLTAQMSKYALIALELAKQEQFDVIHAHDWLTFSAAISIRKELKTPIIAHIHSTEGERNGAFINKDIAQLEQQGLEHADAIIAVSSRTAKNIESEYSFSSQTTVVPNGIRPISIGKKKTKKRIGFVGRFTHQKGPGIFLDLARELSNRRNDLEFVMIGDGYLRSEIKQKIERMSLNDSIVLPGFLDREKTLQLMSEFDVLIAPSIQEPFGIVSLEAISLGVYPIVSSQYGLKEFVPSLAAFDHWDVFNMSKKVEAIIDSPVVAKEELKRLKKEIKTLTWDSAAKTTAEVYQLVSKSH